jgi:hypothetical protein
MLLGCIKVVINYGMVNTVQRTAFYSVFEVTLRNTSNSGQNIHCGWAATFDHLVIDIEKASSAGNNLQFKVEEMGRK